MAIAATPGVSHMLAQPLGQAIVPAAFTHPRANRELRLGNAVVGYLFQRAKRRTIGFVVGPDGLVVRAPKWTPVPEVEAALREKSLWITRKLGESRERQQRQHEARITWSDGVVLPLFGEPVRVALDAGHHFAAVGASLAERADGSGARILRVGLPTTATPEQIRDAVQAWLMRQAREHFKERLDHFAPLLQVQWRKLSLSSAGTRWGSARIDGAIRLNWRLIHFRPAVIDYVVAHELSHLRVMDHSTRFWDTVRTVVPDYAELRGQLKDDAIPKW
ncbi:MAG: SprT family zinc-dependent metalloprotease [Rhodoferax sp.]|nr:SprT family zinc-dependent metalloprotease [Rhodoferax sp.]